MSVLDGSEWRQAAAATPGARPVLTLTVVAAPDPDEPPPRERRRFRLRIPRAVDYVIVATAIFFLF